MEILYNARIVAYLTDKEIGSVWHCAEDLILSVERSERKLECLEQHKNCNECLSFECIGDLDFGAIEHFNGKWRKAIESLNLDDLHKWLVDDSKDKTEMEFRLNKVKGIVGNMWNNDELKQLHNKLNGTFETGGIVPRMISIIATLNENETEESATETVNKWWEILSVIMFNIELVQSRMQSIINETESILNPHPKQTETQKTSTELDFLLGYDGIRIAFEMAQEQGYIRLEGQYFRWLKENDLQSYFCEKLYNQFLSLTKSNKSWGYFSNIFISKGTGGRDIIPDGKKLNRYKTDWKQDRLLEKKDPFCPDGCTGIDLLIATAKREAE